MTTITLPRAVVEQALDAIESDTMLFSAWTGKMIAARTALRAALAQQAEPRNQCGETCERAKLCAVCARGLAEPVQEPDVPETNFGNMVPVGWLEPPHGAFRANPLYKIQFPSQLLSWQIPVFAALAEPVQEPVAKVELMVTGGNAGLATRIVEIDHHLRDRLRPGQLLYTAPPKRVPLTDEEIDKIFKHLCNTVGASYKTMTRAVEQAHGIKE